MKIRITKLAALAMGLLSLSLLGGCASMTNPSRLHELRPDSSYAIDMDATRRAAYVIRKDQPIGICAEPAPDVSVEFVSKIMAEVQSQKGGIDAKAQAELQSKAIELAGRTQTVLFLRESLYRLCEQSLNGNLDSEHVKELYSIALQTALKLAEKDLLQEKKEIIQGLDDPELRRIFEGIVK